MIWKEECVKCKLTEFYMEMNRTPRRCRGYIKVPEQYQLKNHPNYLNEHQIAKMLRELTGDEWNYRWNTSPFDKEGWEDLGIIKAWYKWNADHNSEPYASCVFTLPENLEDLMLIPHAHGSNPRMILNSGDTTPKRHATWSIWYRKGSKLVDPRTIRHKWDTPTYIPYCTYYKL